jgi:hypothetical protein
MNHCREFFSHLKTLWEWQGIPYASMAHFNGKSGKVRIRYAASGCPNSNPLDVLNARPDLHFTYLTTLISGRLSLACIHRSIAIKRLPRVTKSPSTTGSRRLSQGRTCGSVCAALLRVAVAHRIAFLVINIAIPPSLVVVIVAFVAIFQSTYATDYSRGVLCV